VSNTDAVLGPDDPLSQNPRLHPGRRRHDSFSRTLWFDGRGLGASEGDVRDSIVGRIFDADLADLLDTVGFQRPAIVAGMPPVLW
jgi:hypothetical protein